MSNNITTKIYPIIDLWFNQYGQSSNLTPNLKIKHKNQTTMTIRHGLKKLTI